ncbi:MAG: anion permease, partial [Chromatiales bacterium]|nr:anion permease [Chromatiales bacterium]
MTEQTPTQHQAPLPVNTAPTDLSAAEVVLTRRTWQILGIVAATLTVGLITAQFLSAHMAIAAALTLFCISLWATAVVPEYWPALAFFLVAVVFEIAPAEIVFSGFHSSTFWLLFSGIILGAAIRHTGLDQRAAGLLSRTLSTRYANMISGIVIFSVALAFVIPSSMGRIVLLVPIIVALADHMGYGVSSNGRIGMLTAAAFGTSLPAFAILPAN